MAALPQVLRLPRSDGDYASFVLLHVSSNGSSQLDLTLVATEGSYPYVSKLKASRLKNIRAKFYKGSDQEWETILASLLLLQSKEGDKNEDDLAGLEMVATIKPGIEMTLVVRKNVGGITQRLGMLSLDHDEGQEIELFDWAGLSIQIQKKVSDEMTELVSRSRLQERTIDQLNEQLEVLTMAKERHESAMLGQFRNLLNAKKLKIRDQQRLLARAGPTCQKGWYEPTFVSDGTETQVPLGEELEVAIEAPRDVGLYSRGKRKAGPVLRSKGETPESGPLEAPKEDEDGEELFLRETPEHSEEGTDDDLDMEHASTENVASQGMQQTASTTNTSEAPSPPPPRELPFLKGTGATKPVSEQQSTEGQGVVSEDETDDDEL